MPLFHDGLFRILRQSPVAPELRLEFGRRVALSNSRRLKAVTWLLFWSLVGYLVADYFTIRKAGTPSAHAMWAGIVVMRVVAMAACVAFLWLFGPLRNEADLRPRHGWVWQAYIAFFFLCGPPSRQSVYSLFLFVLSGTKYHSFGTKSLLRHLVHAV